MSAVAAGRRLPDGGPAPLSLIATRVALALAILLFVAPFQESFEPVKAAVVRSAGLAIAAAWLAGLRPAARPLQPLDVAVAVWLAVEALAALASRSPLLSLLGERAQHEGLLTSAGLAGLYFGARGARDPGDARATIDWMLVGLAGAGAYALVQAAHLDPLGWSRTAVFGPGEELRPFGTLGHPNLLGAASAAGLAAAAALALGGRRAVAYAAAAAVLLSAALISLSRGAGLGALGGLALALPLAARARRVPARLALTRPAAARAAGVGAAVLGGSGARLGARVAQLLQSGGGSSLARVEIWRSAIAMARERPWLGQGPDLFHTCFQQVQTPAYWRYEWGGIPLHAHSIYLHALATRGLIGLLAGALWAGALAAAAVRAWRVPAARPVVAALAGVVTALGIAGGFGALGIAGAALLVVASGLLAALAAGRIAARDAAVGGAAGARAALAGLAVAAVTLAFSALDLSAERAATRSRVDFEIASAAARQGRPDPGALARAEREASVAAARLPASDEYALRHAQVLLAEAQTPGAAAGALERAEREARRAVALGPARALNLRQLALVLSERAAQGEGAARPEAEAAWRRFAAMAPCDAVGLRRWAEAEVRLGDARAALEPALSAARIYPSDRRTLELLSQVQAAAGDSAAARATLERAIRAGVAR